MSQSQILHIPTGWFNYVNDAAIGQMTAPPNGLGSNYGGQLGKWEDRDGTDADFYNVNISTLYQGRYQYVRLAPASGVPVIGQILFWDTTVAATLFQVTTDPTLSSADAGAFPAGICLTAAVGGYGANLTPGYYTLIQIPGQGPSIATVKFRATLTDAGATGSAVYATNQTNADEGLADVLDDATTATDATVSLFQRRFLGRAIAAPVGGASSLVMLGWA